MLAQAKVIKNGFASNELDFISLSTAYKTGENGLNLPLESAFHFFLKKFI